MFVMQGLARGLFAFLSRAAAVCVTITVFATYLNPEVVELSATEEFAVCFIGGSTEDINFWGMIETNELVLIIIVILIVMAAYSLELTAERWLAIVIARRQSFFFQRRVGSALFRERFEEAAALSAEYPRCPVAFGVHSFVRSNTYFESNKRHPSMHEWQRALVIKSNELRRRVWTLGAIGWTAPLVGGFYACVRITQTFQTWYASGSSFAPVANEIASAAWGVSFSLVVAVPAIWAYKFLCAQNETILFEMEKLSLAIIEQLSDQSSSLSSNTSSGYYITQALNKSSTRPLAR